MKKILSIMAMTAMVLSLNAQPKQQHRQGGDNKQNQEQRMQQRVERIADALELTDDQKAKFTPLYTEYCDAKHGVMKEQQRLEPTEDVSVEASRVKQRLNAKKSITDIQLSYVDQFASILNAKQLHKFYQMEQSRAGGNKMKQGDGRKNHPKGKKGGKKQGKQGKQGKRHAQQQAD